ncbi:TonB-dependent receptor domain-containing protein [Sphingosinicella soli]|uniref:Outer membrane receptor protein involved in Fe transport n=1 Tax=Sphingosinicella soli TaxID=333708 RepID=A0A7W7B291_9SPHN|nr:outer membrane receptor protein involved in Fe transport [Sphingosinicella soli]
MAILGANAPLPVIEEDSAIVVTGSRIARPELENPMPVSVINMEQSRQLGLVTAWAALIREPSISPGVGRGNAGSQNFDGGTASINLRNMGVNRTLTLLDGKRRVSGSARSSAVDLNMIPVGMIDRIEVITGGAAAIYGADAVTGAVNIITKRDIEGIELSGTSGISQKGDGATQSLSLVAGSKLAGGRGSVSIGGTYVKSNGVHVNDRDYAHRHLVYQSNPANTGLADGIPDTIIYTNWAATRLNVNPTFVHDNINYVYLNDAVKVQNINRVSTPGEYTAGTGEYFVEGTLPLNSGEQLVSPLEQFSVIGNFDYQLTDAIRYSARVDYGHTLYNGTKTYIREDSRNTWLNGAGGATAFLDNPFLPDPIRQFMTDNDLTSLRLARIYPEMGIRRDVQKRNAYTISNEIGGRLTGDLEWNGFFQYGRTSNNVSNPGTLRANRWISARDVVADPVTGDPVCRDPEARAAGCVPYNVFGNAAPTDAQRDWLFATRREKWVNTQTIFGGSIVGRAFRLPYGDVSVAIGAERREETLNTREDPLAVPGELAHSGGVTQHAEIDAALEVSEFYGELVVPVLQGLPFARRLEVEGAYRYSDYNTFGNTDAWKAGLIWSPVDGVTFRGVRSRSVRVPNFGELYEPVNTGVSNLDDPCEAQNIYVSATREANCRALGITTPGLASQLTSQLTTGGNPDLMPETSNSLTLGVILQPRFIPGLDITADYWDIDIESVITQFTGNQIAAYCVDLPTIDNIFCDAMTRDQSDPVRAIATMRTQQINASNMTARGLDFGVNYRRDIGEGLFSIGFKGTYLLDKETEAVPGIEASILKQVTGYLDPRFRGNVFASYAINGFNIAWNTQIRGASLHVTNATSDEAFDTNRVPSWINNDVSLGYAVNENYRFTFGVNNVFNVKPPQVPDTYTGSGGIFDTIGRYFFVGANAKF